MQGLHSGSFGGGGEGGGGDGDGGGGGGGQSGSAGGGGGGGGMGSGQVSQGQVSHFMLGSGISSVFLDMSVGSLALIGGHELEINIKRSKRR